LLLPKDVKALGGKEDVVARAPHLVRGVGMVMPVVALLGSSLESPELVVAVLVVVRMIVVTVTLAGHDGSDVELVSFFFFLRWLVAVLLLLLLLCLGKPPDALALLEGIGVGKDHRGTKFDGRPGGGGNGPELFLSPEDRDGFLSLRFVLRRRGFFFVVLCAGLRIRQLVFANRGGALGGLGVRVLEGWVMACCSCVCTVYCTVCCPVCIVHRDGAACGHSKDGGDGFLFLFLAGVSFLDCLVTGNELLRYPFHVVFGGFHLEFVFAFVGFLVSGRRR